MCLNWYAPFIISLDLFLNNFQKEFRAASYKGSGFYFPFRVVINGNKKSSLLLPSIDFKSKFHLFFRPER